MTVLMPLNCWKNCSPQPTNNRGRMSGASSARSDSVSSSPPPLPPPVPLPPFPPPPPPLPQLDGTWEL